MSRRGQVRGVNNWVKSAKQPGFKSALKAQATALARAKRLQPYRAATRNMVRKLKEHKYFDTAIIVGAIGSDMAAAAAVVSLNIVPQGNTTNAREGKKLQCMRLQIKGDIRASGAASNPTSVRCALVWDREPDKAALVPVAGSDIYLSTDPHSFTNRDNAPRFTILREYQYTFPGTNSVVGSMADDQIHQFCEFIDMSKKSLEVIWTKADTTGAVANIVKGDLLWVIQCSDTIANAGLAARINARLDFSDSSS